MTGVLHHVGLTVPDLGQAVQFLTEILGCEHLFTTPPGTPMPPESAARLNLTGVVAHRGIAMLRAGGAFIELFEYEAEVQATTYPRNSDIGAGHLAFVVDNISEMLVKLEACGCRVCAEPARARSAGFEGLLWVYFVTPWGQTMELVETQLAPALRLSAN